MFSPSIPRRSLVAVALAALVAGTGCKKEEEAEPDVASVTLTVGSQTITINSTGTVTGGPIVFTRPTAPTISASFRNAAGTPDPVAHGGDFEMGVVSAATGTLTFTRTAAFTGTLTGVAAGSTTIAVSLFHIAEAHDDFGPFNVPVTVQ